MKRLLNNLTSIHIAMIVGVIYSMTICVRFFKSGYMWSLDYFFPPFGGIDFVGSNGFILGVITTITKHIISTQIVEKIILFCSFFVPFIGGVCLTKKTQSTWIMIFAGIAMTCNPFFYDRFVDGQLGMYLLFCTIPFWFMGLFQFFSSQNRTISQYVLLLILSILTTAISMHGAWFLLVSFIVFCIVFFDRKRPNKYLRESIILGLSIFAINLYWIVPNVLDTNGASAKIHNFSPTDLQVFENHIGNTNNYITTLSLQGYRGEGHHGFVPSYGNSPFPFLVFLFLFPIILIGIRFTVKTNEDSTQKRKLAISILLLTILGYILGLGTAGNTIFSGLTDFLYSHVPFYQAMRESHKRVLLMVIGYAYFGGYGLHAIGSFFNNKKYIYNYGAICLCGIVLLLSYSPSIFLVAKQIPVVDYPNDRYTLRTQLLESQSIGLDTCTQKGCYDILVLPRHQYMNLSFVGKNVLNPSEVFFYPLKVLQGDNIEMGPLYSQSNDPASKIITSYLHSAGIIDNSFDESIQIISSDEFINQLHTMQIQYILLLKESDYIRYTSLIDGMVTSETISPVIDTDHFILYKINIMSN